MMRHLKNTSKGMCFLILFLSAVFSHAENVRKLAEMELQAKPSPAKKLEKGPTEIAHSLRLFEEAPSNPIPSLRLRLGASAEAVQPKGTLRPGSQIGFDLQNARQVILPQVSIGLDRPLNVQYGVLFLGGRTSFGASRSGIQLRTPTGMEVSAQLLLTRLAFEPDLQFATSLESPWRIGVGLEVLDQTWTLTSQNSLVHDSLQQRSVSPSLHVSRNFGFLYGTAGLTSRLFAGETQRETNLSLGVEKIW